jgi:hypothetical protein
MPPIFVRRPCSDQATPNTPHNGNTGELDRPQRRSRATRLRASLSSRDDSDWRRWRRRPKAPSSPIRRSRKERPQSGSEDRASSSSPQRNDAHLDCVAAFTSARASDACLKRTCRAERGNDFHLHGALKTDARVQAGARESTKDLPAWQRELFAVAHRHSLSVVTSQSPFISPRRTVGDNCGGIETERGAWHAPLSAAPRASLRPWLQATRRPPRFGGASVTLATRKTSGGRAGLELLDALCVRPLPVPGILSRARRAPA